MVIGEVWVYGSWGQVKKWRNGICFLPLSFYIKLSFSVLHPGTGKLFYWRECSLFTVASLTKHCVFTCFLTLGRIGFLPHLSTTVLKRQFSNCWETEQLWNTSFLFLLCLTCLKEAIACLQSSFPIPCRETWRGRRSLTITTTLLVLPLLKIQHRKTCWAVPAPSLEETRVGEEGTQQGLLLLSIGRFSIYIIYLFIKLCCIVTGVSLS